MLFNSAIYGVFLVAVFAVYWLLRRIALARVVFLVIASYGFYVLGTYETAQEQDVPLGPIGWSALCLGVIFVGSSLDFAIGRLMGRMKRQLWRTLLLLVSIFYYLGVLSIFKYFNFASDAFVDFCHALGWEVAPIHLRLALPFGISFFTFETMSYTIDVYRREIAPAEHYGEYLLFVCFFPHLVAGPIVRPHQMLPQLSKTPRYDPTEQAEGLWRIAIGLTKKIAIGDVLAVNMVARVFDNPERYSSIEVVVAVYAYAFQIYADFSGYTDVAIGSGLLFGLRLPENFRAPYLARNLQDFWRRWHITLSTWLRDYLYIPLGGSRPAPQRGYKNFILNLLLGKLWSRTPFRTYRNLFITMLLGGLWHGASYNFVIWGALHGAALAVTRMWQRRMGDHDRGWLVRGTSIILTFHYVCLAWIFFRAETFQHAWLMIEQVSRLTWSTANVPAKVVLVLVVAALLHALPESLSERAAKRFALSPSWVQGIVLAAFAVGIHAAAGTKAEPFVYGQF